MLRTADVFDREGSVGGVASRGLSYRVTVKVGDVGGRTRDCVKNGGCAWCDVVCFDGVSGVSYIM